MEHNGEILLYQNTEGKIKLNVQLQDETVWLTQTQMSQLFGKAVSTINEHIKNIYSENELSPTNTFKKFGISEFAKKPTNFYNLDVIISVGYRVKSQQGTQFRIWATQRLKEYLIKGFALNDERFKSGKSMNYFDELQHTPMTMDDWKERLDVILQLNGRELLTHAGEISHQQAKEKSAQELGKYRRQQHVLEHEHSLQEIEADIKRLKND